MLTWGFSIAGLSRNTYVYRPVRLRVRSRCEPGYASWSESLGHPMVKCVWSYAY